MIEDGVPQGTVLGPLLYLLYTNDLQQIKFPGHMISFADDTVIVVTEKNWDLTFQNGIKCLNLLQQYLFNNMLILNESKTNYIAFSINERTAPHISHDLFIHCDTHSLDYLLKPCSNCTIIERVDKVNYLGIMIDQHLKWDSHLNKVNNYLRYSIFILLRVRKIVDMKTLTSVYYALIQSVLMYGIMIWGNCHDNVLKPTEVIHKKLIKIIHRLPKRYPTNQLYQTTYKLSMKQLYIMQVLKFFVKQNKQEERENINNNKPHNTRNKNLLLPFKNKSLGQREISYTGPRIFNKLPQTIKREIYVFNISRTWKYMIKNWLLQLDKESLNDLYRPKI